MNFINRFSSRRQRLDHAFLLDRLKTAKSYKRIAGYFRSSVFELFSEEIATIPTLQSFTESPLFIYHERFSKTSSLSVFSP